MTTTPTDTPIVPGLLAGTTKGTDVYPAVDVTDTTQSPAGSTKSYTIVQLFNFFMAGLGLYVYTPCVAASTTNLASIYNNGTAGVNATLTNSGTLAPLILDGYTVSIHDRVLIKNQSSSFQNGIYSVSNAGSITVPWVLIRTTDFDSSSNIFNNAGVFVNFGSTIGSTFWQLNFTGSCVVGTTLLIFNQFSLSPYVGLSWNTVSGATSGLIKNNGYVTTNTSQTVFTLPTSAAVGDTFTIKGYGSGGWRVAQNLSQSMILGNSLTTTGTSGYLASTNQYDSLEITCVVTNTTFSAVSYGNITVN